MKIGDLMLKRKYYIALLFSFIFAFVSLYGVFLMKGGNNVYHLNWIFLCGALLYSLVAYWIVAKKIFDDSFVKQFVCVSFLISLLSVFLLIKLFPFSNSGYYYILFVGAYFIPSVVVVTSDFKEKKGIIRTGLTNLEKRSAVYFVGIVITLLLLSYQEKIYFMHDCNIFYSLLAELNDVTDLFDLEKQSLAGHISIAYSFLGIIHNLLWKSSIIGFANYAKLLMIVAAYGYWKLFRFLYVGKKEIEYFLITMLFAASPYILGFVTNNSYDYAACCVFPLLAYLLFSHQYIFSFLVSLYFVFCKEPCVVVYSFFLFGIYLVEAIKTRKVIHDVLRYIGLLMPCFLWVFCYFFVVHWTFSGGTILSWTYALAKIKSFVLLNFNWVFVILAVASVIVAARKHKEFLEYQIPIALSTVAFICVSIFTNSAGMMHARYIDSFISQIYILASFIPMFFLHKFCIKVVFYAVFNTIVLVSCFLTIDPLSMMAYQCTNVGRLPVISTGALILSDAGVYNRQYQNFGYITDMALDKVCLQDNSIIFMPAIGGITECFDSLGFYTVVNDGEEVVYEEQWSKSKHTRATDDGDHSFEIHFIVDTQPIDIPNGKMGYYLYTDYAGAELANSIDEDFRVLGIDSFEKNGWVIHRIQFCK